VVATTWVPPDLEEFHPLLCSIQVRTALARQDTESRHRAATQRNPLLLPSPPVPASSGACGVTSLDSRPAGWPFGQCVFRTVCNIEHSVESRLDYRASMRRTTRAFPPRSSPQPQMLMRMLSGGNGHGSIADLQVQLDRRPSDSTSALASFPRTDLRAVEIVRVAEAGAETEGASL
jgi:hypothetical protein